MVCDTILTGPEDRAEAVALVVVVVVVDVVVVAE